MPGLGELELLVTELHPGEGVRLRWMPLRQRHRHVEVVGAARERGPKQRHHESRVGRVEQHVAVVLAQGGADRGFVGGVDLDRAEPLVAGALGGTLGLALVVVGHDQRVEEPPAGRDTGDRPANATGADQQDPHKAHPFDGLGQLRPVPAASTATAENARTAGTLPPKRSRDQIETTESLVKRRNQCDNRSAQKSAVPPPDP